MPAAVPPWTLFLSDSFYTWCSSVIKGEDGRYHMCYSRWPHGKRTADDDSLNYIFNGFSGWLKYSEITYAVALLQTRQQVRYVKTILKGTGDPGSWDRYTIKRETRRYYLLQPL